MKKNKNLWMGVLIVGVIAFLFFYPSIVGTFSPEIPLCDDDPKNYKCVCPLGYFQSFNGCTLGIYCIAFISQILWSSRP